MEPHVSLEPDDEHLPPRFADAMAEVGAAIARCDKAGIPRDTVLAALMADLMPRLVDAYGAKSVASMLAKLSREVSASGKPPLAVH